VPVNEAQLTALEALGDKATKLYGLRGTLDGVLQSFTDQVNHRDRLQAEIAILEAEIEQDYLAIRDL
jgi:hypothetical protein